MGWTKNFTETLLKRLVEELKTVITKYRYGASLGVYACKAMLIRGLIIWQVLTGYFGCLPGGLLKHLGRGYSDLCAALVAVGVGAKELQVFCQISRFSVLPDIADFPDRSGRKSPGFIQRIC